MTLFILLVTRGAFELTDWGQMQLAAFGGYKWAVIVVACVVVTRLIMAPYWMWKEERKRADDADKKLADALDSKKVDAPELSIKIEQVVLGRVEKTAQLVVQISIRNSGKMASIAEAFNADITLPDGETLTGVPAVLWDEMPLYGSSGKVIATVYPQDAIYEKANSPIVPGGIAIGWARFAFDREEIKMEGSVARVSCRDILGKELCASFTMKGTSDPYTHRAGITPQRRQSISSIPPSTLQFDSNLHHTREENKPPSKPAE